MLLLSNSPIIDLWPLAEDLFALGQKPFRHLSKTFSTVVKSLFDLTIGRIQFFQFEGLFRPEIHRIGKFLLQFGIFGI